VFSSMRTRRPRGGSRRPAAARSGRRRDPGGSRRGLLWWKRDAGRGPGRTFGR
jgi:hypothetical protein